MLVDWNTILERRDAKQQWSLNHYAQPIVDHWIIDYRSSLCWARQDPGRAMSRVSLRMAFRRSDRELWARRNARFARVQRCVPHPTIISQTEYKVKRSSSRRATYTQHTHLLYCCGKHMGGFWKNVRRRRRIVSDVRTWCGAHNEENNFSLCVCYEQSIHLARFEWTQWTANGIVSVVMVAAVDAWFRHAHYSHNRVLHKTVLDKIYQIHIISPSTANIHTA